MSTETVFDRLDQMEETPVVTEREQPKQFVCKVCGREFSSAQGLGAHQGSHSAKKELCAHCGQEFMSGAGMGRHLSTAHGINNRQLYKNQRKDCPECGRNVSAKDLARHRREVHGLEAKASKVKQVKVKPDPLTADQIVKAAAAMLWPKGIPHDQLDALMVWHRQTVAFLSQA